MIELKMPKLGESVTEGTVGRWLKQVGERVALYEPLLEVTTDKVDTEIPSPVDGTLLEIRVPEGETVGIGTVIALLGEANEAARPAPSDDPARDEVQRAQPQEAAQRQSATSGNGEERSLAGASGGPHAQGFISPAVARLAAEHAVDLRQVPGTGREGRVTKQDVERFVATGRAQVAEHGQGLAQAGRPAATGTHSAVEPGRHAGAQQPQQEPAGAVASAPTGQPTGTRRDTAQPLHNSQFSTLNSDSELVPLTAMRRAIAEHMVRSKQTAPHVTTVMEADLSRVLAYREAHKAEFERQGARLTFTPFFVQACVRALQEVPLLNASYSDEGILMHRAINVGVAVAIAEGLIVPVIHDADEKSLLGLSRAVDELAERARTRRLQQADVEGGTFTITNHGVSGSLFAMPIINQPQSGILGVGAIQKRPVVVTQGGVDAIAIRPMCYLSLTFDHRLVDGATADQFLGVVKAALEGWAG